MRKGEEQEEKLKYRSTGVGEMALKESACTALPEDPSGIPVTHTMHLATTCNSNFRGPNTPSNLCRHLT